MKKETKAPKAQTALSASEKEQYLKLTQSPDFAKVAKSLKVSANPTPAEAKAVCLAFLKKNEVDDVEKDPLNDIFDYCHAFTNSRASFSASSWAKDGWRTGR